MLEAALLESWAPIALTDADKQRLSAHLDYVAHHDKQRAMDRATQCQVQLGAVKTRLTRLIDAFLDGALDKQNFEERKRALLEEQRALEDALQSDSPDSTRAKQLIVDTLELASSAQQSYRMGNQASRRELAIRLCSNRTVSGKEVSVEPNFPVRVIADRHVLTGGDPHRDTTRTFARTAWKLWSWARRWLERENRQSATV